MSHPHISIIVTAFLAKSKPYLDLCVASIASLDYPKDKLEVIIVSPYGYNNSYEGCQTMHPRTNDFNNAHALNFGMAMADKRSEYFFLLNDDVILTKHSLKNLVTSAQSINDMGIFMPIGNDQQGKYFIGLPIPIGPYRLENIKDCASDMMNLQSPYRQGLMFFNELCLYAVLIPRHVINKVGGFDEANVGKDDWDYSYRVTKAGYVNAICLNSLCWHAGGVTSSITFTDEMRKQSQEQFDQKWSKENDPTTSS